jgi:hypothetical protein
VYDFCEMPQFYSEEFPVARKAHRCVECRAPIEKGEKHLRYAGKWDGNVSGGRQHMLCRELAMFMNSDDECAPFGAMKAAFDADDYRHRPSRHGEPFKTGRRLMARIIRRERSQRSQEER